MPTKLTTTVSKIASIPNPVNSELTEFGIQAIFEIVVVSLVGIYDLAPSKALTA